MKRARSLTALLAGALPCALLLAGVAAAEPDPADPAPVPAPVPPAVPPVPAPGPAPGPTAGLVIDRDGTFAVGTDIIPGVYATAGPQEGGACYWKRIGADNTTLQNALTKQPQVVAVEAGDVAFKTNGCQPWQLTDGAAPPGQNPPWLAQLQLRHNLDILNGLARQSGNGELPPY